ncbi:MAG: hypothetical protein APF84_19300 [Gracilibacter sp. BRH_c7a]|nr:MAG: hypothetical protein APF84_19300 [Gracilibacter sp. BRH_c7a]
MAYSISISLQRKQLSLRRDNKVIKKYSIAIGKKETPTPPGHFTIINKVPNPGGFYGAVWMGLSKPHYGIHGTNNLASIGKEVSKGCIRMYNKDILELSKLITVGTSVIITA